MEDDHLGEVGSVPVDPDGRSQIAGAERRPLGTGHNGRGCGAPAPRSPRRLATDTAADWFGPPNLENSVWRLLSPVLVLIPIRSAICVEVRPPLMSAKTCSSRLVRLSGSRSDSLRRREDREDPSASSPLRTEANSDEGEFRWTRPTPSIG